MILKLILMIVLGLLSAALTHYNKNYYVRVFDDILGREEEKDASKNLGRSFVYGFLFPVYFALLLAGLAALLAFLIWAGIVAGIIFVLVWLTEKIIPHAWLGALMSTVLTKVGVAPPATVEPQPAPGATPPAPSQTPPADTPAPPDESSQKSEPEDPADNPFPGGDINRKRTHTLD